MNVGPLPPHQPGTGAFAFNNNAAAAYPYQASTSSSYYGGGDGSGSGSFTSRSNASLNPNLNLNPNPGTSHQAFVPPQTGYGNDNGQTGAMASTAANIMHAQHLVGESSLPCIHAHCHSAAAPALACDSALDRAM